ncbi:MAG TPA: acyltransferase family protein [Candidatus Sulfomarinibacteraceae bacterium]|nr:acyltransferase family protein [Candidatus Sulfomarinibacteraceae bacterium]
MSETPDAAAGAPDPSEVAFRPDVEGLRGIAVLLVVLFHAGLPVPGGFVGVDVFFVISGFLITGLLLREHRTTGRVSLGRFYARRVRRLLPAAAVVILVTLPAAFAVTGPLDRPGVMIDGAAAALSVSNIRFALAEGDYFTAITQPSPFLHFWSLSVEEQFYLAWPALLFLVARGGRLRVPAALLVVLAGSLTASVLVTQSDIAWAFYSLPTRAWQLAAGGLLAVGAAHLDRLPRLPAVAAGWLAIGGLVASGAFISSSMAYPGWIAVVPTACAAILIAAGERRHGPGPLLSAAPIRFLGRISYSLYLWHWPILVLPAIAMGGELDLEIRVALALGAVAVAALSWRFIEEPFHHGRFAAAPPRRALGLGLATLGAVVVLAAGTAYAGERAIDQIGLGGPAASPGPTTPVPSAGPSPAPPGPSPTPGASGSAGPSAPASPRPAPSPTPEPTPRPPTWDEIPDLVLDEPLPLPAGVRPPLAGARTDTESLYRDGCAAQVATVRPPDCVYGDPDGTITVALVGDSHAGQWFPAFEALADARGWRLLPYVKLSCPFIDMRVEHLTLKREYTECAAWREEVIAVLADRRPDIVVVTMSHRGVFPTLAADRTLEREGEAIGRAMLRLPGRRLVMIDTFRTSVDIPGCIAANPADVRPCAISREIGMTRYFGARERIAAEVAGAGVVDLISGVCAAMPCQVVRDGMIVYRDNHHLTATFSASLAPALEAALEPYVDEIEAATTP